MGPDPRRPPPRQPRQDRAAPRSSGKKHLLVACTDLLTWYQVGDRTMQASKEFVLVDLTGVIVHDRYQNYDSAELGVTHQLCCAHLLRDLADCAETYPVARSDHHRAARADPRRQPRPRPRR